MGRGCAFLLVSALACSDVVAQTPTPDLIAQQVATEYLIQGVLRHLGVSASPYASPVSTDIPIAVLVAAAVHHSNADLFRSRVEEARFYLDTTKSMVTDKDLGAIQVRNAIRAAEAGMKLQMSEASEKLEISRYEMLKSSMPEIVKASVRLNDAAVVESLLRPLVKAFVAQQGDLAKSLAARSAVRAPLRTARGEMVALIKKTPK